MSDTDSSYSDSENDVDLIPEHLLAAAHETCDRRLARAQAGPQLPLGRTTPNARIIIRRHLLRPRRTLPEYGTLRKHRLTSRCWVPLQSIEDIPGTCLYPQGDGPYEHPRRTWVQWADETPVIELSDGSFFLLHPFSTVGPSAWSCCSFSYLYLWRVFTTAFPRLAFGLYTSPLEPTQLCGRAIDYHSFCRRLNGDRNWHENIRRVLFTATVYPPVTSFITPVPRLYAIGATPAAAAHTRAFAECISDSEQSLPGDWTPSSRYQVAEASNWLQRSYAIYLVDLLRDTSLQAGAPGEAPAVPLVVLHHRAANQARKGLQDSWDLEFEFSTASNAPAERAALRGWVPPPLLDEPPATPNLQLRQRLQDILDQLQAVELYPPSLHPIVLGKEPPHPRRPPVWTPWHYAETPIPTPPGFPPALLFGATPTRYPDAVAWLSTAPSPSTSTPPSPSTSTPPSPSTSTAPSPSTSTAPAPSYTEVSREEAVAANLAALSTYASAPRFHVLLTTTRQGRQRVLSGDYGSPTAAPPAAAAPEPTAAASPSSPSASAPAIIVPPAGAELRPVIDYRALNSEDSNGHPVSFTRQHTLVGRTGTRVLSILHFNPRPRSPSSEGSDSDSMPELLPFDQDA